MMMAALGLFGLVAAAPAAAEDATQIAPISAVAAVSAMTLDDSATNKASTMAQPKMKSQYGRPCRIWLRTDRIDE